MYLYLFFYDQVTTVQEEWTNVYAQLVSFSQIPGGITAFSVQLDLPVLLDHKDVLNVQLGHLVQLQDQVSTPL